MIALLLEYHRIEIKLISLYFVSNKCEKHSKILKATFWFCPYSVHRKVYREYCEAMCKLSLGIMELLGMSLGVGRRHFKEFFQGNDSIMRLNYYPPCQRPDLALGTGPHCDPTSLTILHQDQVGGLQVFVDGKWHSISPNPNAFVVNIGDTFMVCCP